MSAVTFVGDLLDVRQGGLFMCITSLVFLPTLESCGFIPIVLMRTIKHREVECCLWNHPASQSPAGIWIQVCLLFQVYYTMLKTHTHSHTPTSPPTPNKTSTPPPKFLIEARGKVKKSQYVEGPWKSRQEVCIYFRIRSCESLSDQRTYWRKWY